MKAVLEEKQKEYQTTDGAEKEKAETDFRKEKIDTLYAGIYKNCGNLEFLQTKISELKTPVSYTHLDRMSGIRRNQ